MPAWWSTRRFGLSLHANIASVPAWAPIGQDASWYRCHLGERLDGVGHHPSPMVEVLAHHRERWGHIDRYDDFWPLLTFDHFDPDQWAQLARDAGAGYTVIAAKHHDGLCWWDAPGTDRTVLHVGPRRNVLAEYAAACERQGIVFGTSYSLLDWADPRHPSDEYVIDVLHAHVTDLVARYGARYVVADGEWTHDSEHWRSKQLVERIRAVDPHVVVNDRWLVDDADVTTCEHHASDSVQEERWELCRGLGHGFGHNRAERAEHHLTARKIVALLTETIAKNGSLRLAVGAAADGSIPELQAAPLREAGEWVRGHAELLADARPWLASGDDETRYLVSSGGLHAIDVTGRGRFADLARRSGRVTHVAAVDGAAVEWVQHDDFLEVVRADRRPAGLASVYAVRLEPPSDDPAVLFPRRAAPPIDASTLLADATPGAVVQLGDGVHVGLLHVPAGVTLRGLGHDRTVIDGGDEAAVVLEAGARVEHVSLVCASRRAAPRPFTAAAVIGAGALLLGCDIAGRVSVAADDTKVRACQLAGLTASGVDRVTLSRCQLSGTAWHIGIDVTGGAGHLVDSCELRGHLAAIRLSETVGAHVRGNAIEARWWGVRLVRTEASRVTGNTIVHTTRAVDVDGGTQAAVSGNVVRDGDSGCVVEGGASATLVGGNRWERCRVGLLGWDVVALDHHDNDAIDLHEPEHAIVLGPV